MEMVYCTASATVLQDKVMLSLLGEEEVRNSKGGKTVEEKKTSYKRYLDGDGHHIYTLMGTQLV